MAVVGACEVLRGRTGPPAAAGHGEELLATAIVISIGVLYLMIIVMEFVPHRDSVSFLRRLHPDVHQCEAFLICSASSIAWSSSFIWSRPCKHASTCSGPEIFCPKAYDVGDLVDRRPPDGLRSGGPIVTK